MSDDVDLLAPIDRAADEMPEAVARLIKAYSAAGYTVETTQQTPIYSRLNVIDPSTGSQTKVELVVAEFLRHAPVPSELGPVLHRYDVAAGKTGALFTRAEVRDAIDVDGLLKTGYSRERLIELATQNDAGFDRRMFADALRRVQRYTDKQYAAYGLDTQAAAALRQQFNDWQQQLTEPESDQDRS
ncbi:nucleotidyl transferase AbiEii/AbiGii toxin family protein [Streptomyces sp. NPDC058469]|uniref:nucleotidyl transferase AbiEii/AbiGii toxin family protein n=1 Tax=Streptomyces sp. NPDC058469 TaxID=3346514 RepID=UPI003667863F